MTGHPLDKPLDNIERVRFALALADAGYRWEVEIEYVIELLADHDRLLAIVNGLPTPTDPNRYAARIISSKSPGSS